MRQQGVDELALLDAAGLGLKHQAHGGVFAGLVAHHVEHGQQGLLELHLVLAEGFFAELDLGVGDLFNFFEHALGADAGRQFVDDQLPLAAGQVFDLPAGAHFERAAAGAVGGGDFSGAGDDLPAARVVGPGDEAGNGFVAEAGVFDQGDAGVGHFAQVVAGDLGGQADGDAAGAVEQRERQARRQLAGLFGGAVVVGHKVHRAFVDLVHQQAGDARQAGLGVAHGGGAVTVPGAEVALPVDQRVALRKVLRHAHQRVVGGLVTVRVKAAQHVAHHAGAFDGLGTGGAVGPAKAQAHARHAVQNAALHGLLAVTHIGQGAALDHAERVLEVSALGIRRQAVLVSGLGGCGGCVGGE